MKTKFIFEIGSNHNQSIDRIKQLIDKAVELKAYAVKFQLFRADELYKDKQHYELLKNREFPIEFLPEVKKYCKDKKIKLGFSVFYKEGVEILKPYVDFYKISSFDILRLDLIKACLNTGKQTYISCGLLDMSNKQESMKFFSLLNKMKHEKKYKLFHCISKYPAKTDEINLNRKGVVKYDGYSDHTVSIPVIIQAICNKYNYIELHFDLDDMKGYESSYGHVWSYSKCKELMDFVNEMKKSNGSCFNVSNEQLKLRANADDGMRE
jgi:N-acetylneuraminate synthase